MKILQFVQWLILELQLLFKFLTPNRHILVFFCLLLILWVENRGHSQWCGAVAQWIPNAVLNNTGHWSPDAGKA